VLVLSRSFPIGLCPTILFPMRSILSFLVIGAFILFNHSAGVAQRSRRPKAQTQASAPIVVHTEAGAIVWLDDVRRGVTDQSGFLKLDPVSGGRHVIRARAMGFREISLPMAPGHRGNVEVRLVRTNDQAELAFQEAEALREKAHDEETRAASVEKYRKAISIRPSFAAAHLELARVLFDSADYKAALGEIDRARQYRRVYPEASAVEGRIYRMSAFEDEAIRSFRRAIREGHGFQPEAHTGLALVYEDQGKYDDAVAEFRTAIQQLSDSEPLLYQLLGSVYEKQEKYKEAVAAYETYLKLAPEGNLAPAVRSIIDQLKQQANQ
jgi:cytochrome c-type biogenesis protein CcmH/NrfG